MSSTQKVFSDYPDLKTAAELGVIGKFIALGYDAEALTIRAVKAKAVFVGQARIVGFVTDKGSFKVTADQRVRLSSGGYCVAADLQPGMSLHAGTVDEGAVRRFEISMFGIGSVLKIAIQ